MTKVSLLVTFDWHPWHTLGNFLTKANLISSVVLDDDKFGPGNRPYWEMKEGRVSTRYPGLLRALSRTQDPKKRRLLFESHRHKVGSARANPARQLERERTGLARQ